MEDGNGLELKVGEAGISAASVKLRGLPFKALEQDISDFFDGFNVQRALLKRYPDGRPNGEVMRHILSRTLAFIQPTYISYCKATVTAAFISCCVRVCIACKLFVELLGHWKIPTVLVPRCFYQIQCCRHLLCLETLRRHRKLA